MHSSAVSCMRPGGLGLTQRGIELCGFSAGGTIADIGCGAGATGNLLQQRGFRYIGIDRQQHLGIAVHILASAEALPLQTHCLDGIICECVLSFFMTPWQVLHDLHRVCRPGGSLLLTDVYAKNTCTQVSWPLLSHELVCAWLRAAGWHVVHFEDHSRALKEYAAQLLWQGSAECACLPPTVAMHTVPWQLCSYGMWVARKEES